MAQQVCVVLSAVEREQLAAIAADRNRSRKHVERARIVLASADREPAQRIAHSVSVSRPTVWRWQQRFAEMGVEGLLRDKTRKPGKAPIAAAQAAELVALTCTEPPHQATHWTGRAMAKAMGLSLGTVQRIWRAHKLQPHRLRTFKLSRDPGFAAKLADIVGSAPALGPATGRTRGSIRRPMPWCCRSTRKARSRRLTAPNLGYPSSPGAARP